MAVNNKSLDRVDLENSFSALKRDARPFTEHEIVSLILLAGSIEQKSYDEHLVQQLYLASETPFDLAILEKAAQQKD